jgi:DNA-binding PadR family transcriptional regulator
MEEAGYLASATVQKSRLRCREYRITAKGRSALRHSRKKLEELYREVIGEGCVGRDEGLR